MRTNLKLSDAAKLERFQFALTNATTDAAIAESLSKFGLSAESLEEGKALLAATREAFFDSTFSDPFNTLELKFNNPLLVGLQPHLELYP